jgi:DNA-binding transcriptional LysR family regulator
MELRHLRYFIAAAEELNFRRAADRLHITRPALSKQIKDMEEELGVRLIERNTAKASLTDAGHAYLPEARRILAMTAQAAVFAREASTGLKRARLTINGAGPLTAIFLPGVLKAYHEKYPEVEIVLLELLMSDQMVALEGGEIQIAFVVEDEATTGQSQFQRLLVLRSSFGVAVSLGHRLAKRAKIDLAEIQGEPLVCFGNEHSSPHADHIRRLFAQKKIEPGRIRLIQGFDSLVAMVASEHGISLMPQVLDVHRNKDMAIVPLMGARPDQDIKLWAVWRSGEQSQVVHHFLNTLREQL